MCYYEVSLNMSDGDGKESLKLLNETDDQQSSERKKKKKPGVDDFSQSIARIAMAQVCEGIGFQSFQQSALDTLADVGVRYIREIGRASISYANLANRSQCNVFDVIQGLEDLGSVQGFSGASNVNHSLSGSGVAKDLIRYVGEAEDIPFVYSIPGFPVVRERKLNPSFAVVDEKPTDEHIPSWLPKFPDPETYSKLVSVSKKESAPADDNLQQVEVQHGKVEKSSLNLQQSLVCNGSEGGVAVEQNGAPNAHQAADSNPFLAPPLRFGDKEVDVPALPPKLLNEAMGHHQSRDVMDNHISALEPLLPANEAARSIPSETDDRGKILMNGRSGIRFKFGSSKKSFSMNMSPRSEGAQNISIWFPDDNDGQDEKKRRAEQIFRENMEYTPGVSSHVN